MSRKHKRIVLSEGPRVKGVVATDENRPKPKSVETVIDEELCLRALKDMQRYLVENDVRLPYGISVNFNEAIDRLDVLLRERRETHTGPSSTLSDVKDE